MEMRKNRGRYDVELGEFTTVGEVDSYFSLRTLTKMLVCVYIYIYSYMYISVLNSEPCLACIYIYILSPTHPKP